MDGLMMDYQLNVPAILRRADELYGDSEIASRLPDKSWHSYTYADFVSRTKKLVVALRKLGLEDGDRVGTFMWNHSQPPRGVHGRAGRRVRHAHAEPPPPSRRQHVHRDARRRPRAPRRQGAVAARRAVRLALHVRARHRGRRRPGARRHDRLRGAPRRRRRVGVLVPRPPGEHRGRDVLHERHDRPPEGRPLLASRDRAPRADGERVPRHLRGRRRACRSSRCSTRTRGASRSRPR